jgi:hypothetical protein
MDGATLHAGRAGNATGYNDRLRKEPASRDKPRFVCDALAAKGRFPVGIRNGENVGEGVDEMDAERPLDHLTYVGRQLQNPQTAYRRKITIIRKKSCAADRQCRHNLKRIRRLDSGCGS